MASHGLTKEDLDTVPRVIGSIIMRRANILPALNPLVFVDMMKATIHPETRRAIDVMEKLAPMSLQREWHPAFSFWLNDKRSIGITCRVSLPKQLCVPQSTSFDNKYRVSGPITVFGEALPVGLHKGVMRASEPAPGDTDYQENYEKGLDFLKQVARIRMDAKIAFSVAYHVINHCSTTAQVRAVWPELCTLLAKQPNLPSLKKRFADTGESRAVFRSEGKGSKPPATVLEAIPKVTVALSRALMLPAERPDKEKILERVRMLEHVRFDPVKNAYVSDSNRFF